MKIRRSILLISIMVLMSLGLAAQTQEDAKKTPKKTKAKPLVTFIELGAESCIPCKMMKPVMKAIQEEYGEKIEVIFHDVNKERQWASTYKIRVIPTQVFLDQNGREFFRHEGFYPKEDIMKLVDKQLGIKRTDKK
ncbi:MAG: thioredoxin family protein [Candidatus Cloacimonas sp.]|jgi:thioredoxin 1|nr:thioredoxin family protein [Candidatus Cloacimonas sp.]